MLSTNLQGGEAYELSPRMHEYCVALVSSLAPQVRRAAMACAWRYSVCVARAMVCAWRVHAVRAVRAVRAVSGSSPQLNAAPLGD